MGAPRILAAASIRRVEAATVWAIVSIAASIRLAGSSMVASGPLREEAGAEETAAGVGSGVRAGGGVATCSGAGSPFHTQGVKGAAATSGGTSNFGLGLPRRTCGFLTPPFAPLLGPIFVLRS